MIKKKKLNCSLHGCGTGQAYDCGYMKKLARTQPISIRSIQLLISEIGPTTNDLPARTMSKNITIKVSAANTYISFCKATPCFRRK